MAAISWTDTDGTATLRARRPGTLGRFASWVPMTRDVGESAVALGTGATVRFVYRTDYGATFSLDGISAHPHPGCLPSGASPLSLAARLVRWLNNGGAITVDPEGVDGVVYTVTVMPGATIADPAPSNAGAMEFGMQFAVKNTVTASMPNPYASVVTAV